MGVAEFCASPEGWGPTSQLRPDLTPCVENAILFTIPSLAAILWFAVSIFRHIRHGKPHNLGRTNLIYWPSQFLMLASAITLIVRAALLKNDASNALAYSPATMLSTLSLAIAWLLAIPMNYYEHKHNISSASSIFLLYVVTLIAAAINMRTMVLLGWTDQSQFTVFCVYFGFNALGWIIEALPRGRTKVQKASSASRFEKANLLSRLVYQYLQPVMAVGYKNPLTAKDIEGMMPDHMRSATVHTHLDALWKEEVAKSRRKGTQPSLFWTVMRSHGWGWVPIMTYRLTASAFTYVGPQLLSEVLKFIGSYETENPSPVSLGIILAFGMFFGSMMNSILMAQFFEATAIFGLNARTSLIGMVYRKALVLSSGAKQKSTSGEITNHMSVDAERWNNAVTFMPSFVSIPFELAVALWLLYQQIGWSVFVGLATIFVMMPFQALVAKFYQKAKTQKLEAMDARIRIMNEILSGIKIVKLYGWEDSFKERASTFRNRELKTLRRMGIVFSFLSIMFTAMPLMVTLVAFAVYATVGGPDGKPGDMSPQVVFVSITLFGMLNRPIGMISHIISETIGVVVASRRIQKFLLAEEVYDSGSDVSRTLPEDPSTPLVKIENGVFAWVKEHPEVESEKEKKARLKANEKKYQQSLKEARKAGKPDPEREIDEQDKEVDRSPTLTNIHLSVPKGSLTAIVGRVGQGKTTLLSSMIGDTYCRQGEVKVYGRMAYVPQQAWIVNATLKDNILFGNAFDQAKYDHIVMACGLLPDIAMLPAGDMTEIGERGINLSGGQKQRVSLARAAYEDADLYLLDDPLSAVDAHVDQHLWQHLIGPEGLLKNKTRLLVTHAIHHLGEADQIVVLKDGTINETGRYQELMDAKDDFYQLITEYSVKQRENEGTADKKFKTKDGKDSEKEAMKALQRQNSKRSAHSSDDSMTQDGDDGDRQMDDAKTTVGNNDVKKDTKAELVGEEKMAVGSVGWHIYAIYAKAASLRYSAFVVITFVIAQACQIGTNVWLKHWTSPASTNSSVALLLGIYALLVLVFAFLNVIAGFSSMVLAALRASERLHENLLSSLLRLPMSYFDTTPLGRIVNRFSSDIFAIDETVSWNFINVFLCGASAVGTIIVIATATPIFLVIVPPLMVAYLFVQAYYMRSSRAMKRIDSVSKSPLYQHFSETLSGVSSIRALHASERFINENAAKADKSAQAYFTWVLGNRWLQIRLELLGAIIVLAAGLFAVLGRESLDASIVGLSLSYALNVTQDITWLVRSYCDLQNQLVAVERVHEMSSLNQEAPAETDVDKSLPPNWPQAGHVVFKNYSTRYRQGLDLVIKNINFEVQPGEKVGIVGRTGAGKSSLTLALFRIVEAANSHWAKASHNGSDSDASDEAKLKRLEEEAKAAELEKVEVEEDGGSIIIDGVDISTVGLKTLRQHLAIIPQDPTLFAGTVRENLDPFNEHQDADLWAALERAHLKEHVTSLQGGLNFKVSQNGDNFSVGQRALICLARALLRKSKILVLDEATAAVDMQTDELIQRTIRAEFKDRTILTIAHRIKTIVDSDKILVLEKGRVAEFDSPENLLNNKDSIFTSLVEASS
ncbi:Canalicular multispecific organic anion transporter 2 [Actinomortierella ambigua]|nr:Canalicular multispecific organic anion transporter 2 [Actinomortierella ambigua]